VEEKIKCNLGSKYYYSYCLGSTKSHAPEYYIPKNSIKGGTTMAHNFGYYDDVAGAEYDDYRRRPYYPSNNWGNLAAGAGLGYLLGFGPLLGLGLGAVLSSNRGRNTNIININTERRRYCDYY
jgi:hypothetical protein